MATRELLTVRVDPLVRSLIERQAKKLEGSMGYIIEWMATRMFEAELPPGYRPGRRIRDDD